MKIAEALSERSDLQKQIAQIRERLSNNALVQEGENPSEDPEELLAQLDRMTDRLTELVTAINLTNAAVKDGSETITALISKRDAMILHIDILRSFVTKSSEKVYRSRGSEIVIKSTLTVSALQKRIDEEAKKLRELETRIQGLNWTTDLIEQ